MNNPDPSPPKRLPPERLSDKTVQQALDEMPEWRLKDKCLRRSFRFKNFSQAFGFMTRVAMMAEKLDHHPDWSNSYNRVEVSLTTHDAGGLTELDLKLARTMDRLAPAS